MISIVPYSDRGLLINFEARIDRAIHGRVLAMADILHDMVGIEAVIPAYCSITVIFDTTEISFPQLRDAIASVDMASLNVTQSTSSRQITIPVCYDAEFALDMDAVSIQTGRKEEEIIGMHTSTGFYVYMLGFMPGFAYMGDLPEDYFCQRKPIPRTRVPQGSVGLAGLQTAVYPFETPGGWQIIGRTPIRMFDPNADPPHLLQAGDLVRFERVTKGEFDKLSGGVKGGVKG